MPCPIGRLGAASAESPVHNGAAGVQTVLTDERSVERQTAVRRLEAVHAIVDLAIEQMPLAELLTELLERLRATVAADTATILLREGDELLVSASSGLKADVETSQRVPMGRGVAGRVAATRKSRVIGDLNDEPELWSPLLRERLRSLATVPLVYGDEVIGVLHVGTER
ncbi:MAG: hypothetical protein QOF37_2290, partial [Thermoleophilaceae bacterium]|nr:hypothetical protein [Thermoleophilaceae bacterium]